MAQNKLAITSLTLDELRERLAAMGLKPYPASQIFSWIYQRHAVSFEEMTNIAKGDRALLDSAFAIAPLPVLQVERSVDGTRKGRICNRLRDARF